MEMEAAREWAGEVCTDCEDSEDCSAVDAGDAESSTIIMLLLPLDSFLPADSSTRTTISSSASTAALPVCDTCQLL